VPPRAALLTYSDSGWSHVNSYHKRQLSLVPPGLYFFFVLEFMLLCILKSLICVSFMIKHQRPEIETIATNYIPEVVSDLSY